MVIRFRPATITDAAKKDMVKRLGKDPKQFFLTRDMNAAEICEDSGLGKSIHHFLARRFIRNFSPATRIDLHRVGDSDLQRQGLESAVLLDDRRPLRRLSGNALESAMGKIRRRQRRRARSRLRTLHGALRLTIPAVRSATNYQSGDNWKNIKYNFGANRNRIRPRLNWRNARSTA